MNGRVVVFTLYASAFAAPTAFAQSDALLEAVRLHSPTARAKAEDELKDALRAARVCADSAAPADVNATATQPTTAPDCTAKSVVSARLTLLTGYLALSEGDADRAFELLGSVKPPVSLEPWWRFYLGEASFYRRDYERAAKEFSSVVKSAPASLKSRAVPRLGEAWLMAGNAAAALPNLEEAANAQGTAELYWERAQARRDTGNAPGAKADLVLLATKFPAHPFGDLATTALLGAKPAYKFTFEERLDRAQAFVDAGQVTRALAELDAISAEKLGRGQTAKSKAAKVRALALYAQGKDADAEPFLDEAMKGPKQLAAEAAMIRAKRALKKNDRPRARELMAAAAKKFPKDPLTEEGLFFAAWLDLQQDHYADAVKTFGEFEKQRPRSRKLDEALWFKALAQLRLEQYPAVRDTLNDLQVRFPKSSLVPQAKYWWARAGQLGGATADEVAPKYEDVIALFPGSFYALLAQARLQELGRTAPPAFPDKPTTVEEKVPPELECALALTRAGLFRDASAEVDAQLSLVRNPDDALKFGHALQQLGEFGSAYSLAARLLWGPAYSDKKPEAVALLYPRAFRGAVEREAEREKIPAWLVWAIMRRESAFRPEVASPADARGLMQLIPPTANAIAKQLGDAAPPPDALFAPEVNIRYGAWYLAKLAERFGHPALVAAAYNAGPPAVARWAAEDHQMPLDLFVELIPYKETRGYVKQVVTDFQLYQSMYGDKDGGTTAVSLLTLPEPKKEGVNF